MWGGKVDFSGTYDFGSWLSTTTRQYYWEILIRGEDENVVYQKPILPSSSGNTSTSYSFTFELVNGHYYVEYKGIDLTSGGFVSIFREFEPLNFENGTSTRIEVVSSTYAYDPPLNPDYPVFTPEDCSSYGFLEKTVCEIKNLLSGIFMPTQSKLIEFQSVISEIQNRAPFNYIASAITNFGTIKSGITDTTTTVTIFGNTGTLNRDILTQTGMTLIFQSFFGLIFLILFVFWGINFIKRIF